MEAQAYRVSLRGDMFIYACLKAMEDILVSGGVSYETVKGKDYFRAEAAFGCLDGGERETFMLAAKAGVKMIAALEPHLSTPCTDDPVVLKMLSSPIMSANNNDTRNIICSRKAAGWAIGISCRDTVTAVHHPRLASPQVFKAAGSKAAAFSEDRLIDLGERWTGYPFGKGYTDALAPVVDMISDKKGLKWEDCFPDRVDAVYRPFLEQLGKGMEKICLKHPDAPERLVAHFYGGMDYYKVMPLERAAQTKIMAYNMHGSLNCSVNDNNPVGDIPRTPLPTKLIEARFKEMRTGELSGNTLELVMDYGWTLSLRLHVAGTRVGVSELKFDVNLEGTPNKVYQQQDAWQK